MTTTHEPVILSLADEAIKGSPEQRVDQREPLTFIAIAAVVGFALALVVR